MLANRWCFVLLLFLVEFVLSAPQGYYYASQQQRINAQRAQAQRLQAQRIQAQNRYQQSYRTNRNSNRNSVSRADSENAKFLGTQNQEPVEEKTLNHIRRRKQGIFGFGGNPCYFRSSDQNRAEGRFLWDLNVYNIYPSSYIGSNCNGAGFSNRPFGGFFQNFLSLFIPGGALNPNPGGIRPLQSSTPLDSNVSSSLPAGVQSDPGIDPSLDSTGSGTSTGTSTGSVGTTNFGSSNGGSVNGAPPIGQLVGGVATTVNGIIQQLAGNARPVYRNYG